MSDKDTVFDSSSTNDNQQQHNTPDLPAELQELIGEGKKYADVQTALKSLPAAQQHIQTLEAENAVLKKAAEGAKTVNDIFDVVSNQSNKSRESQQTNENSADDVVTKVVNVLTEREKEKVAADNVKAASDQLVAHIGDAAKAKETLAKKANELGVGVDFLMSVAAKSPKAFMQYFSNTQAQVDAGSSGSDSSINTEAMQTNLENTKGTKAWWNRMRKEQGDTWYFSPQQAQARLNDATRLGREGFFGKS